MSDKPLYGDFGGWSEPEDRARDCKHGHLARSCELCEKDQRIEALEACVRELADELKGELDARYPPRIRAYPCMEQDYQADMASVIKARELVP